MKRPNCSRILVYTYTKHVIEGKGHNIVQVKRETKECAMIDVATPRDVNVERKKDKKIKNLYRKLEGLWGEVRCLVSSAYSSGRGWCTWNYSQADSQ